jgi:hypothetical protein
LNETSSLVWQSCDGKNGVSDIAKALEKNSTSMIALPIIAAVVAPDAIHAQSCVGTGANFAPGTQTAAGKTANCPTLVFVTPKGPIAVRDWPRSPATGREHEWFR